MEIVRRSVRGVTLLDLTGRLTVSPSDVEIAPLRAAIGELMAGGCAHIGLNLSGLTHLDARGLGELVLALKTVHRLGGRLTLVAPSAPVLKILAVTRLDTIFDRCESETELLARAFPQVPASGRRPAGLDAAAYG
ncbi:MAG: STAS domain-containing protein [Vicinamibacterales bacterium]